MRPTGAGRGPRPRPWQAHVRPVWVVLAAVVVIVAASVAVHGFLSGSVDTLWSPGVAGAPASGSAGGPASPSPSPSKAQSCAETMAARLTVAQRAGQVLMVAAPIGGPAGVAGTVRQYHLGGVFLSGRSSQPAATLAQAVSSLQSASRAATGIPLQISVDQEGGEVQSLRGTDFPTIPSAVDQGGLSTATLKAQTADWAGRLVHAGVSLDLAPVADTVPKGTEKLNPPIGAFDRQYGSDPGKVAEDIDTVVTAAQSAGVLTTLKHFPGLGRVRANTDTSTHAVDNTATVDDPYLAPFQAGIRAGTAAVMISSATYPKLDAHSIATFSSAIVTGLLRQRLGFTGLIVSDDLGAAVALSAVPVGQRAVRFVEAGGDLVLTERTSDIPLMVEALVDAADGSAGFAAQLTAAAQQVISSKIRAGLMTCPAGNG